jgi:succinate dehydrogenase / fumarate reductase, cytochrome b subunit
MPARRIIRNVSIGDLMHYRLPVPGVLSILHRISGALMFLCLPILLWLFDLSLRSDADFGRLRQFASTAAVKIVLLGLAWALLHHLFAGIRYLALDLHWGVDRAGARRSAWIVFAVSLALSFWVALRMFGVM